NTLLRELGRQSHVQLLENHMAVDLITAAKLGFAAEDRCLGVYVLDEKTGEVETIRSDRIVLATGGCGKVYLYTTNPDVATGDGVAMAWRAGVEIANMEFIKFHPTCIFHPKAKSFRISETVRCEGGILSNNSRAYCIVLCGLHGALYAIGEVACTGLHGANRLASNSLLEGLVETHRAAITAVRTRSASKQKIPLPEWKSGNVQDVDELVVIYHNWDEIRRLMWDYV